MYVWVRIFVRMQTAAMIHPAPEASKVASDGSWRWSWIRWSQLKKHSAAESGLCLQAVDVAVNAAVLEATARAVDKTKQEVEAANAAAKAVAEAQQLGELKARMVAVEEQLTSTTEALRTAEASLL